MLLAEQADAEQGLGVERGPGVGLGLLADQQALAQQRLGGGGLLLLEQVQAECGQLPGALRRVGPGLLSPERGQFPPERLVLRVPAVASDRASSPLAFQLIFGRSDWVTTMPHVSKLKK